jgi:hypothetical protein
MWNLVGHVDGHGLAALYEGCDDSLEPVCCLIDLQAQAPVLGVLRLAGQRHQQSVGQPVGVKANKNVVFVFDK